MEIKKPWPNGFTVGELIEELRKLPPDFKVLYDNDTRPTLVSTINVDEHEKEIELS